MDVYCCGEVCDDEHRYDCGDGCCYDGGYEHEHVRIGGYYCNLNGEIYYAGDYVRDDEQ